MRYNRPNRLYYRIAQIASWFVAVFVFRRKILRNEIKGKKGPFVVIANHQAMLDFVNLIGLTKRPMSFVISKSFFSSLPIQGFLKKMGVIPKQQFQTTVRDMKNIRSVVDNGEAVVIYPAGLMCEDGLSTPIPTATYKFLKWLGADVYMAKTSGTYFAMPKWAGGIRPGRTYIDVYKLLAKEDLASMTPESIREKAEAALQFDAYREQEALRVRYAKGGNLEGLEHVLYVCPHCSAEYEMEITGGSTIRCRKCGYEQVSDAWGFLENRKKIGPEIRYVSDWSKWIQQRQKQQILAEPDIRLTSDIQIRMVDSRRHRFAEAGTGRLTLNRERFQIEGVIQGEPVSITVPITGIPTLPFSPGKHIEIQQGDTIYRCLPADGRLVMKYINMLKVFFELNLPARCRSNV